MYMRELRVSYRRCRRTRQLYDGARLNTSTDAAEVVKALIGTEIVETVVVLCVNVKRDVIAYHVMSRGTTDAALVSPRDVFRVALLANAMGVLIGHNHPSGDPSPSADDVRLTVRIREAGRLLGIELVDHVIVTPDRFVSLKDNGHL
jgi:DNA repair protein RadC